MRALFVYKHDVSYTTNGATDRPRENVAPSPSRKTRPRNEPPQRQGRRLRSTQARRRRAPVDGTGRRREYTRSSSGQRAAHVIPQTHNQAATQKNNTRRERLAQARITNQGPGPARPRRPLHIIQVERPANKAAPPKREADAVYPPQHTRSALKNMSVECGKARSAVRGPLKSRTRTPPRVHSAKPPHYQAPHQSANPRRRQTTSVPHTTMEDATVRTASTPSRGKRPSEPAPLPRAKRATARSTPVAPLAHARRHRVTCLELADRFPTANSPRGGRTEPFRTSRRAPRCAARGPSRRT